MKKERVVLGIDGANDLLGWCVFEGKKRLASGTFKAIGSTRYKRVESIRQFIANIVCKYNITDCCMEDIVLKYNVIGGKKMPMLTTYKALAELRGVIINTLISNNVKEGKINSMYPSEWRAIHGIKQGRGVERELSKQDAMKILGESIKDAEIDEIEATLIAMAYIIKTSK